MILKNLHRTLSRLATPSGIIVLFVLAHLVLLAMMLFTFSRINTRLGTEAFDLRTFGYSVEEATAMVQNLDPSTTSFYLFPQLFLLDVIYPVLLALLLSTLIIRLWKLVGANPERVYTNVYLLPFLAMLADYAENVLIARMITRPAELSGGIIKTASILTQTKGAITTASWVIVFILLAIYLTKKWKKKYALPTVAEPH